MAQPSRDATPLSKMFLSVVPSLRSRVRVVPSRLPLSSIPGCQVTVRTPFFAEGSAIVNVTLRLFSSNLPSPVYVNVNADVLMVTFLPDFFTVY